MYAIAQAYGMLAGGPVEEGARRRRRLLSKILDWDDRSTLVLFGDGAGAVVMEPVTAGGFLGFELGADGAGGDPPLLPGQRLAAFRRSRNRFVKMNGREVFRFATRVMVSSAEAVLDECGKTIGDVDVYVPHQANKRIIDYAVGKLGIPPERTVVNVDRLREHIVGLDPARAGGRARGGRLQRRRSWC